MKEKIKFNYILIGILSLFAFIVLLSLGKDSFGRYIFLGTGLIFFVGGVIIIWEKALGSMFQNIMLSIVLFAFSSIFIYGSFSFGGFGNKSDDGGFTIEEYEVMLDVKSDNTVYVTENITVNFYQDGHHGIYRFIPEWLEYTGKDGKTIKRKSKILGLLSTNKTYKNEMINGKQKIRMGSENNTVYGLQNYKLSYRYDMGNDPFNDFDEFIFHAFGDNWNTVIKKPKIIINMPKPIDDYKINFFIDKYRKHNVNNEINYEISGNTLTATLNENSGLSLNNALTVDIELPENYFTQGSSNYGQLSFTISMVILGMTGYIIFMWSKYGKNSSKQVPTIEFFAPDNLNAAEIGYVFNGGRTNKKLTASLIVDLASKGCIKISEVKSRTKKRNKIKITNLYPHSKIYSEKNNPDFHNPVLDLDEMETYVYNKLFDTKDIVILSEHKRIYDAFNNTDKLLKSKFNEKVYDVESQEKKRSTIAFAFILLFLSLFSFFDIEDMDPKIEYFYYISFACVIADFIFAFIMSRRTTYGEMIRARVTGFRYFLETVEKEKLESLVEQNPNYFYDILPYTYVLNISKKWIEKFKNIGMSDEDKYKNDSRFSESIYDAIVNDISYSSSNSGRSSGGGCSSCGGGGGCSSCGGGGSW